MNSVTICQVKRVVFSYAFRLTQVRDLLRHFYYFDVTLHWHSSWVISLMIMIDPAYHEKLVGVIF